MELFFDTETAGFISDKISYDDPKQSWVVQLGLIMSTESRIVSEMNFLIQANGRVINPHAQKVHGIAVKDTEYGLPEGMAIKIFLEHLREYPTMICHNYKFDSKFISHMILRAGYNLEYFHDRNYQCTMEASTELCQLPFPNGRRGYGNQNFKWPKLEELYRFLFNEDFEGAHDALADVRATRRCFYELKKRGVI